MTPPTAALPIAACPVCKLKGLNSSCTASFGIVSCNWCAYQCGPASGDDAEAIDLHNLLCAPAVQATADEAAREICKLYEDYAVGAGAKPYPYHLERIIRKAVSPKAAPEYLSVPAFLHRTKDDGLTDSTLSGELDFPAAVSGDRQEKATHARWCNASYGNTRMSEDGESEFQRPCNCGGRWNK